MKYLVTGGAGFIGSNIVEELLNRGESVRVLDNFSTGKRENLKEFEKDIELIEGDIRSYQIVNEAVKGVDIVLHQAALSSVPGSIKDPITTNKVNIGGTLNMLDASKDAGVKKFIFASSSAVYGDDPELPKHEGMTPNPLSPYAVSKLAGENYCRVFSKIYGLETVCLRYFNVFGPKQNPDSEYSAVIPKFIKLITNNQQPIIYGDGKQTRDFIYVDNVVEANLLAASTKGNAGVVMNCACNDQIELNYLIEQINKLLGKNINPVYAEHRNGDIKHSFADISLIQKNLTWSPKYSFTEGLKILTTNN
ncbi:MAG TPA: SDR family oxidoreductase [Ignavibacteria bacterium]